MTSGTSFAAAHVSGVVALMLSRRPSMTPADVRRALEAGAADLGQPGFDAEFGAGLVNALNALRQ
jgi:subtilisin family serine protease